MKDLTHWFGHSPKSDESSSSLKENEAGSTLVQEKYLESKAASSDMLKCKTPGNNVNVETDSPKPISADSVSKTEHKNSSVKRKSRTNKKVSISDDEDFEVKAVKKAVKKRGRSIKKNLNLCLPGAELDTAPENQNVNAKADIGSPVERSKDQSIVSKKEASLQSPPPDHTIPETKPKTSKNITHFFSPTKKCSEIEPGPIEVIDKIGGQNQDTDIDSKKKSLAQSEDKTKSRKTTTCKSVDKLGEELSDFKSNSTKKNKTSSFKDDGSVSENRKGLAQSPIKVNCGQNESEIKSRVSNAFQMLMSQKQNSEELCDSPKSAKGQISDLVSDKNDDDSQDKTPKEFVKRKKRNRIESETEDDCPSEAGNQQKKVAVEPEATPSQDESKRKSLMNYFQKISKEDAEIQSQKVQFKVEAIVHHSSGSPYKPKSKRESGSHKIPKKKIAKQKRNESGIEWLGSEEVTVEVPVKMSDPVLEVSTKFEEAEKKSQENETKAAGENRSSSLPAKRTLKLNSSTGSSSKAKRLKKAAEEPDKCADEGPHTQAKTTVADRSADIADRLTKPTLLNTKNSAKKLNQASLESTFFKRQCSSDLTSVEAAPNDSEIPSAKSFPPVSLKRMSPSKLEKAVSVKGTVRKSPSEKKKSSAKCRDSSSSIEVLVSCDDSDMTSPPQESRNIFLESPRQTSSDVTTPQSRLWKMRVCLTPKTRKSVTNKVSSATHSPITVDTVSEEDLDVQEVAAVKKKKKKGRSSESETQEPVPLRMETEIQVVYEAKDTSSSSKSSLKLAPLFMRPKKPDRISEQAKQEFLRSGVPEQVKKMIEIQKSMECIEVEMFPRISHVTQLDRILPWTPSEFNLPLKPDSAEVDLVPSESLKMGDMTTCDPVGCDMAEVLSNCSSSFHRPNRRIAVDHLPAVLSLVRAENPNFQVVRYFKLLREKYRKVLQPGISAAESKKKRQRSSRRSRGSNQGVKSPKRLNKQSPSLMWTDKYRPTTSDEVVGNSKTVQKLKEWLEELRRTSEAGQAPVLKPKRSKKNDYEDDFVDFDENYDSNSSSARISNSALLLGPHGSGKTNCVYALAADLGYKVLEINASERRSGKIILAKLSEATQSHQVVSRSQELSFFDPKSSTNPKAGKRKIVKKTVPKEESAKNKLSLILIKDIDIVFEEEDEGFVSAVASLISTSKRPVIFTTTEADCAALKRLVNSSTLLLEFEPDTKALCSWLQVVALVEGIYVSRSALSDLLSSCNGDVRRCLLQLQVWMSTLLRPAGLNKDQLKDDCSLKAQENALMEEFFGCDVKEEDLDAEVNKSSLSVFEHHDCIGALQGRNDIDLEKLGNRVTIPLPMSFGRVWWNIPRLLSLPQIQVSELSLPNIPEEPKRFRGLFDDSLFDMTSDDEDLPNSQTVKQPEEAADTPVESEAEPAKSEPGTESSDVERCSQEEVDAMLSHLQALSTCDLIATASLLPELNADFEPTPRSWQNAPRASLSQSIPVTEGPNLLIEEISRSMCHWLTENSIEHARSIVQKNVVPGRYDPLLPDHQIQRRRLEVADSENAVLDVVASCVRLERSAIALDYLPTLRRISVSEQRRLERNSYRRNRFYHYFKTLHLNLSPEEAIIFSST